MVSSTSSVIYQLMINIYLLQDSENLEAELDEDDPLKIQPNGEDFLAIYTKQ